MKKLALGALMIGLLAACGGGSDPMLIDAAPRPDSNPNIGLCPLECGDGQKCTWVTISDDEQNPLGRIACVRDGDKPVGAACTMGDPGETTGFDDCVAGSYCLGGVCEEICTTSPNSCPADSFCSNYARLFTGTSPQLGVCDFKCFPGEQVRIPEAPEPRENCGTPAEGRKRGCYGYIWNNPANPDSRRVEFACIPVPTGAIGAVHGEAPRPLNPEGNPYLNSCDAGYFPWFASYNDQEEQLGPRMCVAYCVPGETHSADTALLGGVSPYACEDRGTIDADVECRYLHIFDQQPDPRYNGSGVCFLPESYVNRNGDSMVKCSETSSTELIDVFGNGSLLVPENVVAGCGPWPASLVGPGKPLGGIREELSRKLELLMQ
jgi:hypothetical protein